MCVTEEITLSNVCVLILNCLLSLEHIDLRDLCCQDAPSFCQLLDKMTHLKSRGPYVREKK